MFQSGVSLKNYSNYKIGGPARHFCIGKNADNLAAAVKKARKEKLPIFILGGGTNLLISDTGFKGLVLKPEINKLQASPAPERSSVRGAAGVKCQVGAGVLVSDLLDFCIEKGLSGLEWAGGLPGTVGGAIRGNAGAFGGETKDAVKEVVGLDISGGNPKVVKRNNAQCRFGYRNSIFKMRDNFGEVRPPNGGRTSKYWAGPAEIILEATFTLKKGDKKAIREQIEEKIKYRRERYPMEHPNIGSIFKNVPISQIIADLNADITQINKNTIRVNPRGNRRESAFTAPVKDDPFPVLPTAVLIADAGLKGVSWGGAMISPKHPNFIVNVLNAKADDVKTLIKLTKYAIKEKFGIKLEEEIQYL